MTNNNGRPAPSPGEIQCTAWTLCGDWWWVGHYEAVLNDYAYETATASASRKTVALRRLEGLRTVTCYVKPEALLTLRPINAPTRRLGVPKHAERGTT